MVVFKFIDFNVDAKIMCNDFPYSEQVVRVVGFSYQKIGNNAPCPAILFKGQSTLDIYSLRDLNFCLICRITMSVVHQFTLSCFFVFEGLFKN